MNEFVQVGQFALRDKPTGKHLPSIPLYAKTEDIGANKPGEPSPEERAARDIGALFAEKMKDYIKGNTRMETRKRNQEKKRCEAL